MAKNTWRDLLPCKECYQVVKNKHRIDLRDKLLVEVYTEAAESVNGQDIPPYYVFNLGLDSLKRPGAQRYRQIYPLLSEKSLERCAEIMDKNSMEFHRNLWLSSRSNHISFNENTDSDSSDIMEDSSNILLWKKIKKREFRAYYKSLEKKSLSHGKSCHVDFFLSENDSRGLIAKINRREKLAFKVNNANGSKEYIDELEVSQGNNVDRQEVFVRCFVVKIYSEDKLTLRMLGDVTVVEEGNHLSLDNLHDLGVNISDLKLGGQYV